MVENSTLHGDSRAGRSVCAFHFIEPARIHTSQYIHKITSLVLRSSSIFSGLQIRVLRYEPSRFQLRFPVQLGPEQLFLPLSREGEVIC